ncbi:MAG: chemotaxis response regulator protein-glutamate methylesterase [Candidatus Koribacter versatilis]|uniref:Protein-glutamate methylesterase/protein-glutamine glutaminase n=1 Tax=Candidatus Korobacter versatilis TaxID=658062 RepID=A0A932A8I6_9BACT|nr:chemotaxis response regulator protein-glutamate methylesterase [Candidatus Koribacter versatilis]
MDDSAFMRKVLQSIISADPSMEVCGEARDGKDAVEKTEQLNPDVLTMDINMPHVDGLQATEIIMSKQPKPIVIVSSESRDGADITLKALELGAIDFVAKPSSGIDLDMNSVREELVRKLRLASKVRVVRTAVRTKLGAEIATSAPRTEPAPPPVAARASGAAAAAPAMAKQAAPAAAPAPTATRGNGKFPVVVVAASTGGPQTLMNFIPRFPAGFAGAVILVQHMPGTFTSQFSTQLAEIAQIKVKEAEQGELLQPGVLYVCPGSHHLRVTQTGRITLDDGPRISGYRPCADVTMETVAQFAGPMSIGVVLTGMGNDSSRGVQIIKDQGGHVIAQDEATSVIFGMNAEAIKTGAVDQVLGIENIFPALEKRVLYVYGAARVGAL